MGIYEYLIICHRSDASLCYLLKSIDDERNDIYVHVDAKARDFDFDKVKASVIFMNCILSIVNPQNCHQNSLFLEREFLVFVRTRFLHSEVLSGASMHAASDNFSRRT